MTQNNRQYYEEGSAMIRIAGAIIIIALVLFGVILLNSINSEYNLRQIASNVNKMKYSILSFKNLYGGLPGDINNATTYWKVITKDGDGDSKIFHINMEGLYAWQQLELAEMYKNEPKLTPEWPKDKNTQAVINFNVPGSHIEKGGYFIDSSEEFGGNYIGFGAEVPNNMNNGAVLTADEMLKIDQMLDDGLPTSGNINAFSKNPDECFVKGEYKVSSSNKECSAIFKF